MQTRRRRPGVTAALVALGVSLILSGCGDLSRDELNRGVESLSALAAQGELIANGVARDATKSTYTRVMRLRGPGASARGVRWESVIEVGERIVVRV